MVMESKSLSLYELNSLVRNAVRGVFPDGVWVHAEISELRVGGGGHCYLELIEKNSAGKTFTAKARAVIWASAYRMLGDYFESVTSQTLKAGLKVQVFVHVDMHELYGYSLSVTDIEPAYTLGEQALLKKEILDRLEREGVIGLNKSLEPARLANRIAVISSATAAGFGDFREQLMNNPYGLGFYVELFQAVMQGDKVESSIISALDEIYARMDRFDLVVIIRGGGATADLMGFDKYELANHCAQFPLPILSGIGHERDDTVVDAVAYKRVKTPTAAAQWIVDRAYNELLALERLEHDLTACVRTGTDRERHRLDMLVSALPSAAARLMDSGRQGLTALGHRLALSCTECVSCREKRLDVLSSRLKVLSLAGFSAGGYRLREIEKDMVAETGRILLSEKKRMDVLQSRIDMSSPDKILKRGYALVKRDGKFVKSASALSEGIRLEIVMNDGAADVKVIGKSEKH